MTEPDEIDRTDTWCVIGTGPHGLSALKALLENGIPAEAFEREPEVGGNWNYGADNSRVYQSTHLISSKPFTQFPDFPMPDRFPDYPSHWHIKEYFTSYARHFGLTDRITFNADVVRCEPIEGSTDWRVRVLDRITATETTYRFAGIVVANGHPGQADYTGEIIHSADYKGADVVRGRRVVVVGAGNTGCDVAVESAQNAARTWHSTRRGYYYNPKYALGKPTDQTADLLLALRLPLGLRREMFKATLRLTVGDFEKFGLKKPDHKFFETHPIVNQQLPYYVGHGDISPVDDIDRFDGDGVVFTNGERADADLVVFCTGYLVRFPFLDENLLNWKDDHPQLFLQMLTPSSETLLVTGLIQPDSGQWALAHWQGQTLARYIEARRDRPDVAARLRARVTEETDRRFTAGTQYKDSTRHYYEVAHQDYLAALERTIHELEASR